MSDREQLLRERNAWRQRAEELEAANDRLRERIGCGCGGDYGLCSECRAVLAPENKDA